MIQVVRSMTIEDKNIKNLYDKNTDKFSETNDLHVPQKMPQFKLCFKI